MTGREAILKAAEIGSVSSQDADRIATVIEGLGYVCVPKTPTPGMLLAAWASALAEDATGVWDHMIGFSEGILTEDGIPKAEAECSRASCIPETCSQ